VSVSSAEQALVTDRLTRLLCRMLIVSGSIYYFAFFAAYATLHVANGNGMWLPKGVTHPNMGLGIAAVVLLGAGGLFYLWGKIRLQRGLSGYTGSALLGGLLATGSAICYGLTLRHMGFNFQSGGYASCFFGLTAVNLLITVLAGFFFLGIANRSRLGLYSKQQLVTVDAFGEFFLWISAVSAFSFFLLYIIPFLIVA
jgi:heme/copper-type cytochrome/quinol oxidase subunit 3